MHAHTHIAVYCIYTHNCYRVCGSYADMHAGRVSEALLDFTGGVHMHFDLKSAPADLWNMMYRASQANALMGCETAGVSNDHVLGQWEILYVSGNYIISIYPVHLQYVSCLQTIYFWCFSYTQGARESILPNGVVMGHAYTITGVYQVRLQAQFTLPSSLSGLK